MLNALAHEKIRPVAMCRFGEAMMHDAGLDPVYVPHGVDRSLFHPRPNDRDAIRDELGLPPDAYVVGIVAANTGNPMLPRKAFPQTLQAFSRFAAEHDDVWLYAHTQLLPGKAGGINLEALTVAAGCPTGRVRYPPSAVWHLGWSAAHVSNLYQAFDVLLNPSMGEGFGVPIIEAQACGVPVIASDHSAMTELTKVGWLVGGDPWWDGIAGLLAHQPRRSAAIHTALEAAYERRGDQELRDAAARFAAPVRRGHRHPDVLAARLGRSDGAPAGRAARTGSR